VVDVTDIVEPTRMAKDIKIELGPGGDGRIEVWGLTGWYLSLIMKILQVYG
jgi:hypothetical protein